MPANPDHLNEYYIYSRKLGNVLTWWSALEGRLSDLLGISLKIDLWRARMIWNSFISARGKLDLIERSAWSFIQESSERASLFEIIKEARRLNDLRNTFVHAAFWKSEKDQHWVMERNQAPASPKKYSHPIKPVKIEEISKVADDLSNLLKKIDAYLENEAHKLVIHEKPLSETQSQEG